MAFASKKRLIKSIGWIPACPQLHTVRAEAVELHDLGTAGIIRESPRMGLDNALTPRSRKTKSGTSSLDAPPKRRMTLEHQRALVFAFFTLAAPIYAGELGEISSISQDCRTRRSRKSGMRQNTTSLGSRFIPFPLPFCNGTPRPRWKKCRNTLRAAVFRELLVPE